ncbi:hypothetical protein [Halalkalibacter urbisdiaboli]|uniref:hypothetical protein n=1 Tax=Halalkalibacter urbisdiaboli TaxID=1960589 RepID=UPI000B43FA25|nr:hypothetical protein [Halalkalibacter urbisdiaboli]
MWSIMIILLFVFTVGMTVGGLLAAPRIPPRPFQIMLVGIFFMFLAYIGMILGMFLSGWFGFRFIEIMLSILALLLIVAAISRFHPTFGFFHRDDKIVLAILGCLFLLMGFEWGILDWRAFFTLFAAAIFFLALFVGMYIQQQVRATLWRYPYHAFTPLIWLLFVTILKLL